MKLQFRLRTLMIVVTIFCIVGGWFGSEVYRAEHRHRVRIEFATTHHVDFSQARHPKPYPLPMFRDLIGDIPYERITFKTSSPLTAEEQAILRETFPEAEVGLADPD